jgi:molybdate transport system regulatory protein
MPSRRTSRPGIAQGGSCRARYSQLYIAATRAAGGAVTTWIDLTIGACFVYRMAAPKPNKPLAGNRLSIRVDLESGARIGPGKIAVLEEIARSGSISAAGRMLKISYRRTWELVEELNATLGSPVVTTAAGGSGGGGATLTELGEAVVSRYRAIEIECAAAARKHLAALDRLTRKR